MCPEITPCHYCHFNPGFIHLQAQGHSVVVCEPGAVVVCGDCLATIIGLGATVTFGTPQDPITQALAIQAGSDLGRAALAAAGAKGLAPAALM